MTSAAIAAVLRNGYPSVVRLYQFDPVTGVIDVVAARDPWGPNAVRP
jgi:hypothetical protein